MQFCLCRLNSSERITPSKWSDDPFEFASRTKKIFNNSTMGPIQQIYSFHLFKKAATDTLRRARKKWAETPKTRNYIEDKTKQTKNKTIHYQHVCTAHFYVHICLGACIVSDIRVHL